ncbi:PREDICTED: lipase member H-like [Cyphomyrmex costatus]|uniref:phospholipase A1 n=1 Tax=Cyphomyrmex costatus TaxID=456900 RepID=A0A195CRA9_9HYME|nr:PREDICTED: lipase member H-like [Cyphomyrmex costatus]KYN02644.1 Lipase member H [Cyphomyrmex costatus]
MTFPITQAEGMLDVLDEKKRIVFFIFGFDLNSSSPLVVEMIDALCDGGKDNVVLLDWSKYSTDVDESNPLIAYRTVFGNSQKIGPFFANSVEKLCKRHDIYIVSFSVGVYIASFIGNCTTCNKTRITGLDPANPILSAGKTGCYLSDNDATMVDVVHSDMGGYGTPSFLFELQFFLNSGTRFQPNCSPTIQLTGPDAFCSHAASVRQYIKCKLEPTLSECKATKCPSYISYLLGLCKHNEQNNLGYNATNK